MRPRGSSTRSCSCRSASNRARRPAPPTRSPTSTVDACSTSHRPWLGTPALEPTATRRPARTEICASTSPVSRTTAIRCDCSMSRSPEPSITSSCGGRRPRAPRRRRSAGCSSTATAADRSTTPRACSRRRKSRRASPSSNQASRCSARRRFASRSNCWSTQAPARSRSPNWLRRSNTRRGLRPRSHRSPS